MNTIPVNPIYLNKAMRRKIKDPYICFANEDTL